MHPILRRLAAGFLALLVACQIPLRVAVPTLALLATTARPAQATTYYTTISINHDSVVGSSSGTMYAILQQTLILPDYSTVSPQKFTATVTAGTGTLTLPSTDATTPANVSYIIQFVPTGGPASTLGTIIPRTTASTVTLGSLLAAGNTVTIQPRSIVNDVGGIVYVPSLSALGLTTGDDGQRVLVTGVGIYRYDLLSSAVADGTNVVSTSAGNGLWIKEIAGGTNGLTGATAYATIALLAASTGYTDGDRRLVKDWGFYRYDASSSATADGYLVVTPSGGAGRWIAEVDGDKQRQGVNVTTYGAAGDGTTDDTTAVQAAITATSNGTVFFPAGTYKVTSSLTKTLAAGKRLRLVGLGAVTIASTISEPGSEAGILDIQGTGTSSLALENITISHTGIATVGKVDGIAVHNGTPAANSFGDVTLRNVTVTGCSNKGIFLAGLSSGQLLDCQATSNNYAGCELTGCQNVVVQGGAYSSNGISGGSGDYGISLGTQASYGGNSNILIQGITANNNYRKGIDVHDGVNVAIRNNFVTFNSGGSNATPAGIYAVNESTSKKVKDVKIEGNFIDCNGATGAIYGIDAGPYGTTATAMGTLTISGNTIINCNGNTAAGAILVRNPSAGGVALDKLVLTNNNIVNGSGATAYIIRLDNNAVNLKEAVIAGNNVHSATAVVGIGSLAADASTIVGNIVKIDSGTTTYGLYAATGDKGIVTGNNLMGGATYTNSIFASGCVRTGNTIKGVEIVESGITSKTWDPPSVASDAAATTTVTVSGATVGDFVVPSFSNDLNSCALTGYVSTSDTVTVVLFNPTAGAIDLASGTLRVRVRPHS